MGRLWAVLAMGAGEDEPELSPVLPCCVGSQGMEDKGKDAVEGRKDAEDVLGSYVSIPGYVASPNKAEEPSDREQDGEDSSDDNVALEKDLQPLSQLVGAATDTEYGGYVHGPVEEHGEDKWGNKAEEERPAGGSAAVK